MSTDNLPSGSAGVDHAAAADLFGRQVKYRQSFEIAADAIVDAIRTGVGDGGELICELVATVAANLGSLDAITAGRPGSWEASHVQALLQSTVPSGELLRWRTAPVEIVENVQALLTWLELGEELYEASLEQIWAALATAGHGIGTGDPNVRQLTVEGEALYDAAIEPIRALRADDFARYADAFTAAVRTVCDEMEYLMPEVEVSVRFTASVDADGHQEPLTADLNGARYEAQYGPLTDAPLEVQVWQAARALVPPPGFTVPLRDLEAGGNLVDQLVAARRLPHQRIPELAHYPADPAILRSMAGGTGGRTGEGATQ